MLSSFALKKDPTVWLGGTQPANTRIPLSFLGNAPAQANNITTPREHLQVKEISKFWQNHFL